MEREQLMSLVWERDRVDTAIHLLTKGCELQRAEETVSLTKDPLLYILARLALHYKHIKQDYDDTDFYFDTLEISSMTGRNLRIPFNDAKEPPNSDPIIMLHMGKRQGR